VKIVILGGENEMSAVLNVVGYRQDNPRLLRIEDKPHSTLEVSILAFEKSFSGQSAPCGSLNHSRSGRRAISVLSVISTQKKQAEGTQRVPKKSNRRRAHRRSKLKALMKEHLKKQKGTTSRTEK
jgi:hypothetical protein